ncbi:hypothetical protein [Burkholderia sp. 22PA0106]|uniref:hypothetical protein n=1 Tax=Burkholderia sp. 22PA0106 TaxID=3237371 RepID=UPI0039C2B64B
MGLFVDGPVMKSWFGKNAETVAYRDFVDLKDAESSMPFAYMGIDHSFKFGVNEICEIWLGPFGEHLYHVHEVDDPRYDSYAGGNPINRRSDPGRAYLFLTVADSEKCGLTIRSFARQFKKANRYAGNFEIQGDGEPTDFVSPLPDNLVDEHSTLAQRAKSGKELNIRFVHAIGFDERFLAKLARGIGYKLFGEAYLDTQYGIGIQLALWEKDRSARGNLIRGVPLFSDSLRTVKSHISVPGTYSVLLWAIADVFALILTLPDGNSLSVVISDEPGLWSAAQFDSYREGVLFIVAPQIQTCVGPVALPEFLAHVLGNAPLQSITALEGKRVRQLT